MPPDRSAALVLSVINCKYCSSTGICQIQQIWLEIWLEPDLAGFPKMAGFWILPEPGPKSGTTILFNVYYMYNSQ